jgi:large subunit ribosomal protein L10
LTRAQKEQQVAELKERFGRATCVYVADYRGIDVKSVNQLRSRIHKEGGGDYEYRVTKNSVLRRAAAGSDVANVAGLFEGPTAVAISYGDAVGLAKILVEFAEEYEVFELKTGVLEGRAIEPEEIGTLATLPSLDELRGRLIGLIQAPAVKLARLISEPGAQLARVVAARGRQEA